MDIYKLQSLPFILEGILHNKHRKQKPGDKFKEDLNYRTIIRRHQRLQPRKRRLLLPRPNSETRNPRKQLRDIPISPRAPEHHAKLRHRASPNKNEDSQSDTLRSIHVDRRYQNLLQMQSSQQSNKSTVRISTG